MCYLIADKPESFYMPYIDDLNGLSGSYGWFSEKYGSDDPKGKKPFRLKNTMRLDAIRTRIDEYDLYWADKCVLLTSLILAMDSVDNTLGHYVSYLSGWSKRSESDMVLRMPMKFPIRTKNRVCKKDVFDVIGDYHDLVYLDPPYGSNNEKMPSSRVRYSSYYHIWKTIILNDKPDVFGKANRRVDSRDGCSVSVFEEFRKDENGNFVAMNAISELIAKINAHYVLLSYGSGGRTTKDELYGILSENGRIESAMEIDYKRNVMSSMKWTDEWLNSDGKYKEYLFLIEK